MVRYLLTFLQRIQQLHDPITAFITSVRTRAANRQVRVAVSVDFSDLGQRPARPRLGIGVGAVEYLSTPAWYKASLKIWSCSGVIPTYGVKSSPTCRGARPRTL